MTFMERINKINDVIEHLLMFFAGVAALVLFVIMAIFLVWMITTGCKC